MSEESGIDSTTELVLQIAAKNATDLAFATNSVIDHLERRSEAAEATLYLIRDKVMRLVQGRYMPTSWAIEQALFPEEEEVELRIEQAKNEKKSWP